ncbi:hypothetical protein V6N13_012957 [Hibiscus sabdariffa]
MAHASVSLAPPYKHWYILSKLKMLPKIKIFAWRAAHEALPVSGRLRMIQVGEGICPMCSQHVKTVVHALRDCALACDVLEQFDPSGRALLDSSPTCKAWLEHCSAIM